MTVCVAAIFRWNYASKDQPPRHETAAIAISDRMLTAGDVQYEPTQQKVAHFTPRVIALIAGDYSPHSQAIRETHLHLRGMPDAKPYDIATFYGRALQGIKLRQAEAIFLSPLGLNSDTFLAQQKDMSEGFVSDIKRDLQLYQGANVEALIVGSDGEVVQIYSIDSQGIVENLDDVGFGAIGIGAGHAKSRLMEVGYINQATFAPALASVFGAKKSAELRPE